MNVTRLRELLGRERQGDEASAAQVLARAAVGYIGMSWEEWPYVVPISFAYEDQTIYFHGGGSLKRSLLAAEPHVCLAAVDNPGLMAAGGPCDDNFRYESVLAFGTARLLEDRAERENALRLIVAKYHPAALSAPFSAALFAGTLVYALSVAALTFRRNPDS